MSAKKKYAINLTLFKIIGFYQIVDPNSTQIFGFNIYKLVNIVLITITTIITTIGLSGFVNKTNNSSDDIFKIMQLLFYISCITVGNIKMVIIIYNADEIFKLFNIAHESFLSSKHCRKYYFNLIYCGKRFSRTFQWYIFLFFMTAFLWIVVPIIILNNRHIENVKTQNNENIFKINVVNLKFPISVNTYNTYYKVIYIIESIIVMYSAYGLVIFDTFLIVILQLISTHYQIISSAYEHLEVNTKIQYSNNLLLNTIQEEITSITFECQNIYKKLEIFYKISRPVALIYMVGDTTGMITMPYLIVMSYMKSGTIFDSNVITFLWTLLVVGIQSYMYCSLFQLVNERKERVNFGIYSSNWTQFDIMIKKRMILIMKMNNSNNLKINVTPSSCIDLPTLASIVRSSYSITSVLINSNLNK